MAKTRFSLRLLFVIVTLSAILLAGWSSLIEPYRRQAAGFDRITDLSQSTGALFAVPLNAPNVKTNFEPIESSWHRTLVEVAVGREAALKIREVEIPGGTSDEGLRFILTRMTFLTSIDVSETKVSTSNASVLGRLPELKHLVAVRSGLGDSEMEALSSSESITTMRLTANPISDESVPSLSRMTQLEEIFVRWTKLTPSGAEALNAKLPNCSVWFKLRAPDADGIETP